MSLIHLSWYFEKEGWEPLFMIRNYQAGVSLAKKHNIKNLVIIEENISVDDEVREINNHIKAENVKVVFFEITERKLTEYKGLIDNILKCCISFDGFVPDDFRLVVNWDVDSDKLFCKGKYPKTKFLLGPEYVVLPVEFDASRIIRRIYRSKPQRLLIAMGGADELNITGRVVEYLVKNMPYLELNIIIGSGYEYKDDLERFLAGASVKYQVKHNITNMFEEYMDCDLAIGAGGLTSYELVATRTPAILIAAYEHQIARCNYFAQQGFVKYLGYRDFDVDDLIKALDGPFLIAGESIIRVEEIRESVDELLQRYRN